MKRLWIRSNYFWNGNSVSRSFSSSSCPLFLNFQILYVIYLDITLVRWSYKVRRIRYCDTLHESRTTHTLHYLLLRDHLYEPEYSIRFTPLPYSDARNSLPYLFSVSRIVGRYITKIE